MKSISVRVSMVLVFVLLQGIFSPVLADPMTILLPQFKSTAAAENAQSRLSLLSDRSFVNLEIRELGRTPEGAVLVEYVVTLENVTSTPLPDGPGRELVLLLPAGVRVEPGTVAATLGTVSVVGGAEGQPTTVEWDVELSGAASSGTVTTRVTVPDLPIHGVAVSVQ